MPVLNDWEEDPQRFQNILKGIGCAHGREGYCKPCQEWIDSVVNDPVEEELLEGIS